MNQNGQLWTAEPSELVQIEFRKPFLKDFVKIYPLLCLLPVASDLLNLIEYTNTKKLPNQQRKVSESEVRELS